MHAAIRQYVHTPSQSNYQKHNRLVKEGPHVTWVDNFSKFMARSVPTVAKGIFSSCLWTGEAVFECTNKSLDMAIKLDQRGEVIPAMPNNVLGNQQRVTEGIQYVLSSCRSYYDVSLVKKYDVRNIPLKIDTKRYPNMKRVIEHKQNSTQNVHPVRLIDHNIGSNDGLISVVRGFYEAEGMNNDTCTKYKVLNVDENIYWRTLKVKHITYFQKI